MSFCDEKTIERLKQEFIPYAGNCADLQWRRTPAARWFMGMAGQVNPRVQSGETTQGFYIAGADGTAYGFSNRRSLDRIHALMDHGRDAFYRQERKKTTFSEEELKSPFTRMAPSGTSIVRVFTRIRPVPITAHPINKSVGRDHLWILQDEVKEIIRSASRVGQDVPMPNQLSSRMVRFHLIDNVRGEPDMWTKDQVVQSDFTVKLLQRSGEVYRYSFQGKFEQKRADGLRWQKGTIRGEFEISTLKNQIMKFRAYSEGEAFGRSKYTANEPAGSFPLVIAMTEADDELSRNIPPQAITWGNEYFQPR